MLRARGGDSESGPAGSRSSPALPLWDNAVRVQDAAISAPDGGKREDPGPKRGAADASRYWDSVTTWGMAVI